MPQGYSPAAGPYQGGYSSQPPIGYPVAPPAYGYVGMEHPQGTLILILGIISIVFCQFTGPFAWVMGRKALREIDSSGTPFSNRGQVQAGMICGIVGSVLLILGLLYIIFMVVIVGVAATTTPR